MLLRLFHRLKRQTRPSPKRGQAIMLLLALLMVMAAFAFWIVDTQHSVLARLRAQDCGDPTVLAAAKWQAAGLNLIGELNLIHAYMITDDVDNIDKANALHELQKRITLTTPLLALQAAEHTAQENHADPLPGAKDFLEECLDELEFPDLYNGATEDFREGMRAFLRNTDEIHVFPVHNIFPETTSLLGNQGFYEAILAEDYCWFWFHAYNFLRSYRGHGSFGAIPQISTSLFFTLSTTSVSHTLHELYGDIENPFDPKNIVRKMNLQMEPLGHPALPPHPDTPKKEDEEEEEGEVEEDSEQFKKEITKLQEWMAYGPKWTEWSRIKDLPIRSSVKPEFDVLGAYAAISVSRDNYSWITVAKPFGGDIEGEPPRPLDLILGGFNTVRLVPIDSVEANLNSFNPEWFNHIYRHVKEYSNRGRTFNNCRYCRALQTWDGPVFRQQAITWLLLNSHKCKQKCNGCCCNGDGGGSVYAH